jgi:glucosyl-3-phosphoglycerate phosphatase
VGQAHEQPKGSRHIVVWRHGRTAWNLEGRFQGQTDVPLDATGIAQAERAARVLAGLRPDAIIASDLSRAVRTAEALAALTDIPVALDEGLRETYAGRWQGLNDDEIRASYSEEFAAWKRGEIVRRGGGETEQEVADRIVPAILDGLEKVPPGGTLVVATHGGAGRAALGSMLDLPNTLWGALGGLSNCCWSILGEATRGWRLLEHNAGTLLEPVIGDDE